MKEEEYTEIILSIYQYNFDILNMKNELKEIILNNLKFENSLKSKIKKLKLKKNSILKQSQQLEKFLLKEPLKIFNDLNKFNVNKQTKNKIKDIENDKLNEKNVDFYKYLINKLIFFSYFNISKKEKSKTINILEILKFEIEEKLIEELKLYENKNINYKQNDINLDKEIILILKDLQLIYINLNNKFIIQNKINIVDYLITNNINEKLIFKILNKNNKEEIINKLLLNYFIFDKYSKLNINKKIFIIEIFQNIYISKNQQYSYKNKKINYINNNQDILSKSLLYSYKYIYLKKMNKKEKKKYLIKNNDLINKYFQYNNKKSKYINFFNYIDIKIDELFIYLEMKKISEKSLLTNREIIFNKIKYSLFSILMFSQIFFYDYFNKLFQEMLK
jgi:hypothetical protein